MRDVGDTQSIAGVLHSRLISTWGALYLTGLVWERLSDAYTASVRCTALPSGRWMDETEGSSAVRTMRVRVCDLYLAGH
jgi:hypothetical protein